MATTTTDLREKMAATLRAAGIPYKQVQVYGSQIMVTAWSERAANQWVRLLRRFCTRVSRPVRTLDTNKENRGTVLRPTVHEVYRIGATI